MEITSVRCWICFGEEDAVSFNSGNKNKETSQWKVFKKILLAFQNVLRLLKKDIKLHEFSKKVLLFTKLADWQSLSRLCICICILQFAPPKTLLFYFRDTCLCVFHVWISWPPLKGYSLCLRSTSSGLQTKARELLPLHPVHPYGKKNPTPTNI